MNFAQRNIVFVWLFDNGVRSQQNEMLVSKVLKLIHLHQQKTQSRLFFQTVNQPAIFFFALKYQKKNIVQVFNFVLSNRIY